jgi:hypothetical protein
MAIDWSAVGGAAAAILTGVGGWLMGRKPNQAKIDAAVSAARAETVNSDSTSAAVALLRAEVERLSSRVQALEGREGRLIRHVYRLEGLMRGAGIEPPPFDIDSDPVKAGGTD